MNASESSPQPQTSTSSGASSRLKSLDALRGFDLFWIIGAEEIVRALSKAYDDPVTGFFVTQLTHKTWAGLGFYDLIFPLFVFIAGVSMVFSLTRSLERVGKVATCKKILWRAFFLYILGIFCYGGISGGLEKLRLLGVLQRIALAYLFTGFLFVNFRFKGLVIAFASLLVGYWALMTFVPVPGVGAGNFEEGKNLANYIDKQYLPFFKWDGDHDPEGLLSTLPAIGTCLLGVFAGLWIRRTDVPEQKKVVRLLLAGVAGVLLGFLWNLQFPIIKKIWTSSFVLAAGGYACIFFAVFYQVVEIWKIQKWAAPFVWIGMNPITLYVGTHIIDFSNISEHFVGGPVKAALGKQGDVLVTIVAMALLVAVAHFLYRRKIFLRL